MRMAKRKSIKSVWRFLFHDARTNTNETPYAAATAAALSWYREALMNGLERTVQSERTCSMHARNHRLERDEENADGRQRSAIFFDSGPSVPTPRVCESFRMDCVGWIGSYYCFRCNCVMRIQKKCCIKQQADTRSHIPQQRQQRITTLRRACGISFVCSSPGNKSFHLFYKLLLCVHGREM